MLGFQHGLRRLPQARDFGRHVLPSHTPARVSRQCLAIAIGNPGGFQPMTKRVFRIVDAQLREPGRGRLLLELLPAYRERRPAQRGECGRGDCTLISSLLYCAQ